MFPVVCGSATTEVGIDRLADLLVEIGPPPADRPTIVTAGDTEVEVAADPDGDPLAFAFKTIADPFVGQVTLFKVLSGTIRNDDHLVNSRTGTEERLHGLFVVRGKEHEPVDALAAGDLGGVAKLARHASPATRWPSGASPCTCAPIERPPRCWPWRSSRRRRPTTTSWPPRSTASRRRTRRCVVERDEETHQTLLWGTGDTHLAIAVERLERKFGVKVDTEEVQIRYRETITEPVERHEYTHKKQSGGHGQYARVVHRRRAARAGRRVRVRGQDRRRRDRQGLHPRGGQRASRRPWPAAGPAATRWSTSGSPSSTARSTASTATRWRSARPGAPAFQEAIAKADPVVLEPISAARRHRAGRAPRRRHGRPQRPPRPGAGHRRQGDGGEQVITALVPQSQLLPLRHRPALAHRRAGPVHAPSTTTTTSLPHGAAAT